ncbi:MAG: S-adenosylmethionine:tRNA ribosyltransferase-isomerase, partial [Sedimentisphaerales bacterium]|nr:S-adenosylmethionine:tRNA ribosyltransferase-isomerase [Sedimentisphaerales bacterium]
IKIQGHDLYKVTLHINYGTFKEVEAEDITQHQMHWEEYEVEEGVYRQITDAKAAGRPIVAVGTTSCRTLESVAKTGKLAGQTNLFLYPGCEFKMVDILITNFHLPYSTLLMLVSAFGGYDLMMRAYKEAIQEKYRFYSYGDGMIII